MLSSIAFTAGVYAFLFGTVLAICRIEYEMPRALTLLMGLVPLILGLAMGTVGSLIGFGFVPSSGTVGAVMFVGALGIAAV